MLEQDIANWLENHINFETGKLSRRATMPTLERIKLLAKYLGDPQDQVDAIHITGTNGKTSTARITETLLRSKGLYTSLITSPHLNELNERIILDGEPANYNLLTPIFRNIRELENHVAQIRDAEISWFEIMVAASFYLMSQEAVDVGVVEVGMGGKYDATNICKSQVSVFTNIELDHTNYLGTTKQEIATEKSGIIKEGNIVVISEQDEDISSIIEEQARSLNTRIFSINKDYSMISNEQAIGGRLLSFNTPYAQYRDMYLNLFGYHQGLNALTAVVAAESFIDAPLGQEVIEDAFREVTSPGRMEIIQRNPLVIADGAHNVAGAQALQLALEAEFSKTRRIYVLGFTQEKDPQAMMNALQVEDEDIVIATSSDHARAMEASKIFDAAKELGIETVIEEPDPNKAVENALGLALDDDQIIITGSLYIVKR